MQSNAMLDLNTPKIPVSTEVSPESLVEAELKDIFNEQSRNILALEVHKFKEARDKLIWIDKQLAAATGGEAVVWSLGFSFLLFLVQVGAGVAIAFYAVSLYQQRVEAADNFHNQLAKMVELYRRGIEVSGPQISFDKNFIKMLEEIAPFVPTDVLMPWKLEELNPAYLSKKFINIMSRDPHRVRLVGVNYQSLVSSVVNNAVSTVSNLVKTTAETQLPQEMRTASGMQKKMNKWYNLYQHVASDTKLTLYGYEEKSQQVVALKK